jgi:hypothetical protein
LAVFRSSNIIANYNFPLNAALDKTRGSAMADFLPITVISAISLFIIKEIVEFIRKRKARKRKISAIKNLLAEEIEINYWAWKNLTSIGKRVKDSSADTKFYIFASKAGFERFEYIEPDKSGGGQSFPKVTELNYQKLILDIAELDNDFYEKSIEYNKAIAELLHIRNGVYEFIDEIKQGYHYAEGFISYMEDELPGVYEKMNDLYFYCKEKKLEKHRMR